MEKTYQVQRMSCGGCVNNVKRALLQVPDVKETKVQLHLQRAVLTMSKSIDVGELQAQLNMVE